MNPSRFHFEMFLSVPVHRPFPLAILKPDFLFCFTSLQFFLVLLLPTFHRLFPPFLFPIFESSDFPSCFFLFAPLSSYQAEMSSTDLAFFVHLIPFPFPSHQITPLYLKNLAVPAAEGCMMRKHRKPWGLQAFPSQE